MRKIKPLILSLFAITPQQAGAALAGIPVVVVSSEALHLDYVPMFFAALVGSFFIRGTKSFYQGALIYLFSLILGGGLGPYLADVTSEWISRSGEKSEWLRITFACLLASWLAVVRFGLLLYRIKARGPCG